MNLIRKEKGGYPVVEAIIFDMDGGCPLTENIIKSAFLIS